MTTLIYTKKIFQTEQNIPSWKGIEGNVRKTYNDTLKNNSSPLLYIPLLNIIPIIKGRKNTEIQTHIIQASLITIGFIYGFIV
jgi:hypothetical protein